MLELAWLEDLASHPREIRTAGICRRHVKTDPLAALPSGGQFSVAVDTIKAPEPDSQ
jgi:hypothetical protein